MRGVEVGVRHAERVGVGDVQLDVAELRAAPRRQLEHRVAAVDADHRARRTDLRGELRAVEARPAADVEHALARARAERLAHRPAALLRLPDPVDALDPPRRVLVEDQLAHDGDAIQPLACGAMLDKVLEGGGEPAVSVGDRGLSYGELREAAAAVAKHFEGAERVAVWAESTLETCVAAVAALATGTPLVPVNPKLGRGELEHVLTDSEARRRLRRARRHRRRRRRPRRRAAREHRGRRGPRADHLHVRHHRPPQGRDAAAPRGRLQPRRPRRRLGVDRRGRPHPRAAALPRPRARARAVRPAAPGRRAAPPRALRAAPPPRPRCRPARR